MGEPSVNGELNSKTLEHLTSYPVVSDTITGFKNNPYGRKSLDLGTNSYQKFVKPMTPYLIKPYSFVAPYVAKADSIGDAGLSKVDNRVPILKEDTKTIQNTIYGYAYFPLNVAGAGKSYVYNTYDDQYKKVSGEGYVKHARALISTGLYVASDTFEYIAQWYSGVKKEAKEITKEKTETAGPDIVGEPAGRGQSISKRVIDVSNDPTVEKVMRETLREATAAEGALFAVGKSADDDERLIETTPPSVAAAFGGPDPDVLSNRLADEKVRLNPSRRSRIFQSPLTETDTESDSS
ncbi:MAG: hypothetical protein Q9227_007641 [Pyrenula ochraceoflavens]